MSGDQVRSPSLHSRFLLTAALFFALTAAVHAMTSSEYLQSLEAAARVADPEFKAFSASRGQQWFNSRHGTDWSCSTCHTGDPLSTGRHATTGRQIAPLAPAANPARLVDVARMEKWFKRNCNDVLGRACSAAEKGDVLAYLTSLKR